ncbi:MAG: hypothetical protein Q4D60_11420 [Eubacteriales bacterium]|nr:hypothetical protein [Eubacteriales bacterium]
MRNLLRADGARLLRSRTFWLCIGGMLLMAAGFIFMQYTAMDYKVPLSRVVFLPVSFYGIVTAALISLYVGQDFQDGGIRNKVIAGNKRTHVYFSSVIMSCLACAAVFLVTTFFTAITSYGLFSHDAELTEIFQYCILGLFMSLAYGSLFSMIALLCRNKTTSIVLCMFIAFFLLFLCLHTNQILMQPEYKNGVLNPHYVTGAKRWIYELLHDGNPSGQSAQLSAMHCLNPIRFLVCDIIWMGITAACGNIFRKCDIR